MAHITKWKGTYLAEGNFDWHYNHETGGLYQCYYDVVEIDIYVSTFESLSDAESYARQWENNQLDNETSWANGDF